MTKIIGFGHPQNEPKKEAEKKPKKSETEIAFTQFINDTYQPFGKTEQMNFRSSMELQYEFREMTAVSLPVVAKVMQELGFKAECNSGRYLWIVYEKKQDTL